MFLNEKKKNVFIQVTSVASGSFVDMSLCKVGNICLQASLQMSELCLWSFSIVLMQI